MRSSAAESPSGSPSWLPAQPSQQVQAKREKARRLDSRRRELSLTALVPELSPSLDPPDHLRPIAELIERSGEHPVEAVTSTPPQHGKTQLIVHGLAWLAKRYPTRRHVYGTYSAEQACNVSDSYRIIAREYGLEPRGRRTRLAHVGGGSVQFVGRDGLLTGSPADGLIVIDDPVKNRIEAESPAVRATTMSWFRDVVLTRRHPSSSVLVNMTRWHVEDLAGSLINTGWHHCNLAALAQPGDPLGRREGQPLWPSQRPLDFLIKQMTALGGENGLSWLSLYQGGPRRRGGSVFEGVWTYDVMPERAGLKFGLGVDLAYSTSTRADWSVIVALARERSGKNYILQTWRRQEKPEQFLIHLCSARRMYPSAKMWWYASSTEVALAASLNRLAKVDHGVDLKLEATHATADKLVRALPAQAAWNAGDILVPLDAPWLEAFTSEVLDFAGLGEQDDQVDALAAGYDALGPKPAASSTGAAVIGGSSRFARSSML